MNELKLIEMKSLVGEHILSGCDESKQGIKDEDWHVEDANCLNFVLDGTTYTAIEDYQDGYRSCMKKLIVSDYQVKNTFTPIRVLITYREKSQDYLAQAEILDIFDIANGKRVIEVGTDNFNDYYPVFVASFSPENMSSNDDRYPNA